VAVLGFGDLKDTALPSLWDAGEITKLLLQDGRTFEQMLAEVRAGMQAFNAEMLGMPHYGALFAVQDDVEVEYPIGISNGFEEATEYSAPDPKRGKTTGHNIPLTAYDRALGWTMRYLKKARAAKLDADVRTVVVDARNLWQQKLLTRFFKMEGETVGSTSNASVPLADGGTVDSTYVPPVSPEGETFLYTHDHFLRHSSISDANLSTTVEHLQEHGHAAPFDIIAARVDVASWTALTNFKAPEWPGIVYHASGVERAALSEVSNYFGYIETDYGICRLWLTPRVPTNIYGVYKTYGPGDPRNPVRVRIDPDQGFGFNLAPGQWANLPTHLAVVFTEFGVGIGEDRTNGVCVKIAGSGDYATPTIS
jgi:hypothetical protein